MIARGLLLFAALLFLGAAGCRERAKLAKKRDAVSEALRKIRARYPDARVESFTRYRFIHWQLLSVAPKTASARCAPRWIVAVDAMGRVLAKAELLREASKGLRRSDSKVYARLCQDMLLNRLGSEILHPDELAQRCQKSKPRPDYCREEVRSLVLAPAIRRDRLIYWRTSCVDGRPERVELDTKSLEVSIRSLAALLDERAFARSPAVWARSKLPKLSPSGRRDLLKRLRCKDADQRAVLLERARKDEDPGVRARALERLNACFDEELEALLMSNARKAPSPVVRQRAIELLGTRTLSRAARRLLGSIRRDGRRSTNERYAALRALKRVEGK